ncbi:protein kinase [Streptomyces sp. NPDC005301]|uniref:serine/threonine-protein kinase n=1 Tax=Streptomyces sp. NPDC005301 TaxID=3156874 RepID=UPI0033A204D2
MGEVFAGRYELVDPIGRGGVGAVWRAWDHRRRRYVAAKVLQQSDAHSLLRFVREQALRIDHPHVLAPASWAADDDKVLFTMDLVAGGSLVHLVGDYGPLPPHFVCTLLDQLLAGLAAVHAEGVVHRDIKPANVLLEATGTARPRLRLSDFGIAMRLGEPRLTETNYVVGTPGYFAPEQMTGADPDFPADLFAVGLVAVYLLEGAKPDAKALIEHFAAHGTPRAPQSIPEPLWQVVATLLQPDPDARFRTATGARKALASAIELLPEPGPDDELVEVFDQVGPLPAGFGPEGPLRRAPGVTRTPPPPGAASPDGSETTPPWPDTGTAPSLPDGTPIPPRPDGGTPPQVPADGTVPPRPSHGATPRPPGTGTPPHALNGAVPPYPGTGPGTGTGFGTGTGTGTDFGTGTGFGTGAGVPPHPATGIPPRPPAGAIPPRPAAEPVLPQDSPGQEEQARHPGATAHPVSPGNPMPSAVGDDTAPQPSTMSDTGSFHLPPPRALAETPRPQPAVPVQPYTPPAPAELPTPTPVHALPYASTHVSTAHQPAAPMTALPQHALVSTAPYAAPAPAPQTPRPSPSTARHRTRRPGPPAKVALPMLLLALACFAVGFWALARI